MPFQLVPDPVGFMTNLSAKIADAVNNYAVSLSVANWLPVGSITLTTPVVPYPQNGPLPFAVLRVPGHSASVADQTGTTSNIPGKPNRYCLYYYEMAYDSPPAARAASELRCINTYAAICTEFLTGDGDNTLVCLPDEHATIVDIELMTDPNGPFIEFGTSGSVWIGLQIDFVIEEHYN